MILILRFTLPVVQASTDRAVVASDEISQSKEQFWHNPSDGTTCRSSIKIVAQMAREQVKSSVSASSRQIFGQSDDKCHGRGTCLSKRSGVLDSPRPIDKTFCLTAM